MPDTTQPEAENRYPTPDEPKDLHAKEMDLKEGNTKGPTGNPVHPNAHPHRPNT